MPGSTADDFISFYTGRIRGSGAAAREDALEMRFRYRRFLTSARMRNDFDRRQLSFLRDQHNLASSFFKDDIREAYRAGAMFGTGEDTYKLTAVDRKNISRYRQEGKDQIDNNFKNAYRNQLSQKLERRDILGSPYAQPGEMRVHFTNYRNSGLRTGDGRTWNHDTYNELVLHTKSTQAFNRGTIEATARQGVVAWEIHDSPDCGMSGHNSPDKANGVIVNKQDATVNMLSHPYCVRTFEPRPDITEPPQKGGFLAQLITKEAKQYIQQQAIAAAANVVLVGAAAIDQAQVIQKAAQWAIDHDITLKGIEQRLQRFQADVNQYFFAGPNVIDINTGLPVRRFSLQDIVDHIFSYGEDLRDNIEEVPGYVKELMGLTQDTTKRVVNDTIEVWDDFRNTFENAAISLRDLASKLTLEAEGRQAFLDYAGDLTGGAHFGDDRFGRFSLPNLGGAGRKARLALSPANKYLRATITATKERGLLGNIRIFRNGLFRVGAEIEARTRSVYPNLSIVPKGPIRIYTKLNRAGGFLVKEDNLAQALAFATREGLDPSLVRVGERLGAGRITSISGEIKIITREKGKLFQLFANPSMNFNINLRKLGLKNLSDIRNLTLERFRKLNLKDIRLVSWATEMQLRGFGRLDFTRILRMSYEDAKKLYELGLHGIAEKVLTPVKETATQLLEIFKGERVFDTREFMRILRRDLAEIAPRNVVRKAQDLITNTGERIAEVFASDRPLNDALTLARDLQMEMYDRVFVQPRQTVVREGRNLLEALWNNTYRKYVPEIKSRFGAYEATTGDPDVTKLGHTIKGLSKDTKLYKDISKTIRYMEERYPGTYKFDVEVKDLGTRVDDEGIIHGVQARYGMTVLEGGRVQIQIDSTFADFYDTLATKTNSHMEDIFWFSPRNHNPAGTLMHEMGHHVFNLMTEEERAELAQQLVRQFFPDTIEHLSMKYAPDRDTMVGRILNRIMRDLKGAETYNNKYGLSFYSVKDSKFTELVAEQFTEYHMASKPGPVAEAVGKYIDDLLGVAADPRPVDFRFPIPMGKIYEISTEGAGSRSAYSRLVEEAMPEIEEVYPDYHVFSTVNHTVGDDVPDFGTETATSLFDPLAENVLKGIRKGVSLLEQAFVRGPKMLWEFVDDNTSIEDAYAAFIQEEDSIAINRKIYMATGATYSSLQSQVESGWHAPAFVHYDDTPIPLMVHEYSHTLLHDSIYHPGYDRKVRQAVKKVLQLARADGVKMSNSEIALLNLSDADIPGEIWYDTYEIKYKLGNSFLLWVHENIGGYATANWTELIAEANMEYVVADNPRPAAVAIGRVFSELYG